MAKALVVAAAIIMDDHILAAQRSAPPELAGRWELPGGKVEEDEEPAAALRREIIEELGVEIQVGELVVGAAGDWPIVGGRFMRVWLCTIAEGEPAPLQDHTRLEWVPLEDHGAVDWLVHDLPIVAAAVSLARADRS